MYSTVLAYSALLALSAGTLAAADQNANANHAMNLTLFGNQDCAETVPPSYTIFDLSWNLNQWPINSNYNESFAFLSYKLSRATTLDEQLDFSGANEDGSDPDGLGMLCALFHETASPDAKGDALNANQCYNLTGPASCAKLFGRQ